MSVRFERSRAPAISRFRRRFLSVEQLESRLVLSALLHGQGPVAELPAVGDQDDYLQPPAMAGLASLESNIAAAVAAAWQIPADTLADSWVVGLSAGVTPTDLSTLGFTAFAATPYLHNTYILDFGSLLSVSDVQQEISAFESVEFYYPMIVRQQSSRAVPNDPLFNKQWHLRNTGQSGGTPGADANIVDVWNSYTGSGVVIGIVDDGLQHMHPDLSPNYLASFSYDFNGHDSDPTPAGSDSHGTSVAGVAAARGGNSRGVSGAAPQAGLAGLRLTAAGITDAQEADALSYQNQSIDIYNSSWGPEDAGTVQGAGPLTLAAIANSVASGRGGLGNIYTWAAGNGLQNNDNVNYDGYANSRYVIAVAAIDQDGVQSYYSEPGAPILVTAYSSGSTAGIVTTALLNQGNLADPAGAYDYTSLFGGTSSSAPLVAGVVALMLEANPELTWRDVQHVLVHSAEQNDPTDSDWVTNGAGHLVNHKYGFGAIDAQAAVDWAASWRNVGPQLTATSGLVAVNQAIPDNSAAGVSSTITLPDDIRIESVEVVLNATHTNRGDLRIVLTSPSGTESILAEKHDDSGDNYNNWVFCSKRLWDEGSAGDWTIKISDGKAGHAGTFNSWQLNIFGTTLGEDFGDAPDDPYGTLASSNGARHMLGGPLLGSTIDAELDGQPSADASGDGADEDGVLLGDPLVVGAAVDIRVTSSPGGGKLDYFFDWDGIGGFGNQPSEVLAAELSGGLETVRVTVPSDAQPGQTFARFRISSDGGLGPLGPASDGEVEDYLVRLYATEPLRDFGDAPDTPYGTLRSSFGPSHIIGGPRLGTLVDGEPDGLPNPTATGDGADDDGVLFRQIWMPDTTVEIEVTSSPGGGQLDFFVDFDGDGVFGNHENEVFHATLTGGTETLLVDVPANAVTGVTYARFRISSAGNLGPLGLAYDGEVEDYQIVILPKPGFGYHDFEDFDGVTAPALPTGWTTESSQSVFWTTSTTNSDSAPNNAYRASVNNVSESRLVSPPILITKANSQLRFRNHYNFQYGEWYGIKFGDAGVLEIAIGTGPRMDIIAAGGTFVAGGYNGTVNTYFSNPLGGRNAWVGNSGTYLDTIVDLPAAALGQEVRFYWIEGTDNQGSAPMYYWQIDTIQLCGVTEFEFDFGDAPDPTYPTLAANSGARHVVGSGIYLGSSVDIDADGQPTLGADGDDQDGGADEDGVTFTSVLTPGGVATVDVVASQAGLLNAWIDFNADGDWADAGEQIFRDLAIAPGTNSLSFTVPAEASVTEVTYSRFRLSSQSGLTFDGPAPDGEVEDYTVAIVESQVAATIAGRHIFYNGSAWDGSAAANANDDQAIATDKSPLLPGHKATFANYTSYSRGINGLMIDIANLADPAGLSVADFQFRTGNTNSPADWPLLAIDPALITITVRAGAGVDGSDRVTILLPDSTVRKTWLQVTVQATAATGLAAPDVHYWGNAIGDSGNSRTDTAVNVLDALGVRANPRTLLRPASIDIAYDYNRDKQVNVLDELVVRANLTTLLSDLNLIDLSGAEGEAEGWWPEAREDGGVEMPPAASLLSPVPFAPSPSVARLARTAQSDVQGTPSDEPANPASAFSPPWSPNRERETKRPGTQSDSSSPFPTAGSQAPCAPEQPCIGVRQSAVSFRLPPDGRTRNIRLSGRVCETSVVHDLALAELLADCEQL